MTYVFFCGALLGLLTAAVLGVAAIWWDDHKKRRKYQRRIGQ